jgi:hypothetical protein
MFRGDVDGLIEVDTFENVEAGDPLLRFGKRTVGHQHLATAPANGRGGVHPCQAVAEDADLPPIHLADPLVDVVLFRHVCLGGRIDAHEHHVAHGGFLLLAWFRPLVEWRREESTSWRADRAILNAAHQEPVPDESWGPKRLFLHGTASMALRS